MSRVLETLERAERVASEYAASRTGAHGAVHRDGTAIQWLLPGVPLPFLNTVALLDPDDPDQLERCLDRFAEADTDPRFALLPHAATPAVTTRLAAVGLVHAGGHAVALAPADGLDDRPVAGIAVERVDASTFARFHAVDVAGFENGYPPAPERFAWWLEVPGWSLWLATIDGEDASIGILYVRDGVGYLATGATVPALRGRGGHLAVIRARIAEARRRGCDLVTGQAAPGSASHRNLERAGLVTAAIKEIWARP